MKDNYKDLEDYGVIGNLETCALVASDGPVDWLCLPYLDTDMTEPILDSLGGYRNSGVYL